VSDYLMSILAAVLRRPVIANLTGVYSVGVAGKPALGLASQTYVPSREGPAVIADAAPTDKTPECSCCGRVGVGFPECSSCFGCGPEGPMHLPDARSGVEK
jgi:hypothetical protein